MPVPSSSLQPRGPQQWEPGGDTAQVPALSGLGQQAGPGGPGLGVLDPTWATPVAGGLKRVLASTRGLDGLIVRIL